MFLPEDIAKIEMNRLEENAFRKALSNYLSGHDPVTGTPLLVGCTPYAIECCTEYRGLSLIITRSVIRKCMKEEIRDEHGKRAKNSGHGLTEQMINDVIWAIKRPVAIIKGASKNTLAVMTDVIDQDNRYIFAFISLNRAGTSQNINAISSMYGREDLDKYLSKCIDRGMILAVNTEKVNDVLLSIGGHFSEASALINFDNTVAYSLKSVNRERCDMIATSLNTMI